MRNLLIAVLFGMAGCSGANVTATGNELGLKLTQFDDGHVEGTMTTQIGDVSFRGTQLSKGVFNFQFDRGRGVFGSTVDWNSYTADFVAPENYLVNSDDRFVVTALATAVEEETSKTTELTDNLFRQASLWGAHPVGPVILTHIAADPQRSWTTLCSAGACNSSPPSRSFSHSGSGCDGGYVCGTNCNHAGTTTSATVPFGKAETGNPCQSRCGAGCYSIGTSAWTQDCGNHDICERRHTADCGGEFTSASDDFTFAPNCSC